MAKFIRLHSDELEVLVNVDLIKELWGNTQGGTSMNILGYERTMGYDEPYRKVLNMIGNATGGIGGIDG